MRHRLLITFGLHVCVVDDEGMRNVNGRKVIDWLNV